MKSSDLHSHWDAPDNSRITSKQYSFRLPVHVAAKLSALNEMYPQKTRTEIVGDLLSTAIEELVKGMPVYKGRSYGYDPHIGEEIFEEYGPADRFWKLAEKYYQELEKEMGNENPPSLRDAEKIPKKEESED